MAQLFGVNVTAISKHLKNLFGGRIVESMTIPKMETKGHDMIIDGKSCEDSRCDEVK